MRSQHNYWGGQNGFVLSTYSKKNVYYFDVQFQLWKFLGCKWMHGNVGLDKASSPSPAGERCGRSGIWLILLFPEGVSPQLLRKPAGRLLVLLAGVAPPAA